MSEDSNVRALSAGLAAQEAKKIAAILKSHDVPTTKSIELSHHNGRAGGELPFNPVQCGEGDVTTWFGIEKVEDIKIIDALRGKANINVLAAKDGKCQVTSHTDMFYVTGYAIQSLEASGTYIAVPFPDMRDTSALGCMVTPVTLRTPKSSNDCACYFTAKLAESENYTFTVAALEDYMLLTGLDELGISSKELAVEFVKPPYTPKELSDGNKTILSDKSKVSKGCNLILAGDSLIVLDPKKGNLDKGRMYVRWEGTLSPSFKVHKAPKDKRNVITQRLNEAGITKKITFS